MIADRTHLIAEILERYPVGEGYASAYLDYWFASRGQDERMDLSALLALPDPEPMWFDYALSTNWRGREMAEFLPHYMSETARRYLDVGCGFGGLLVAFSKLGLDVRGIEIDVQRIALAEANCSDNGLTNCVIEASILEDDLPSRLGSFDVITLIDVIEHVLDVPKTLGAIVQLLNPGGVALLEIPNKDSLAFVSSDGHFNLYGITLLDRSDAIEYHRAFHHFEYDVGNYYSLDFYRRQLQGLGCSTRVVSSPWIRSRSLSETSTLFPSMLRSYRAYRRKTFQQVPPRIDRRIRACSRKYIGEFASAVAAATAFPAKRDEFKEKYLTDFWTVIARKPA
jgi:SAM-dependent methyltransferase